MVKCQNYFKCCMKGIRRRRALAPSTSVLGMSYIMLGRIIGTAGGVRRGGARNRPALTSSCRALENASAGVKCAQRLGWPVACRIFAAMTIGEEGVNASALGWRPSASPDGRSACRQAGGVAGRRPERRSAASSPSCWRRRPRRRLCAANLARARTVGAAAWENHQRCFGGGINAAS